MYKASIIKAKIKRSKVVFKNTVLWDDISFSFNNIKLSDNEEAILMYTKPKETYSWLFTNYRLILLHTNNQIVLSDLINVELNFIKDNPDKKMENEELVIATKEKTFTLLVDENTWHLFYDIFKFIINNDDND